MWVPTELIFHKWPQPHYQNQKGFSSFPNLTIKNQLEISKSPSSFSNSD